MSDSSWYDYNIWSRSIHISHLVSSTISDKISDKTMQNNKGETWGHLSIISNESTHNLSKAMIISILLFAHEMRANFTGINVKGRIMPLDSFDNKGQTPFHHTLSKPGCLHLARWLIQDNPGLLHQEVLVKQKKIQYSMDGLSKEQG